MRLPVATGGAVHVQQPAQTVRRLEMLFLAFAWLAALWITRRPSRP